MNYADEKFMSGLDAKAEEMKKHILSAKSEYPRNATKYYVSCSGNDENDGKSPEKAIRSLEKLNSMAILPGQVVLFERGGLWRGQLATKTCVTYSAYGEGEKPKIYGSGGTASGAESWEATDTPNVWRMTRSIEKDVGNILFDGKFYSRKRFARREKVLPDGRKEWTRPDGVGEFGGIGDLKENLQFHHYKTDNRVYLYCDRGNPGEVFKTAEVCVHGNCVLLTSGVTVDNLCVMFTGSHGCGGGASVKVTVRNCEIGWCGGSFLGDTTLYGNAVELYGNCSGFYVYDNYIHDMYDTGITHQYWSIDTPAYMHDCRYERNLIENCYWSIEYVARGEYSDENRMSAIRITDNILRHAGEGWGTVRASATNTGAHIKGWPIESPADDFVMSGNIFDRSGGFIVDCGVADEKYIPEMDANTYVQYEGAALGYFGINDPVGRDKPDEQKLNPRIDFDSKIEENITEKLCDKNASVYTVKK